MQKKWLYSIITLLIIPTVLADTLGDIWVGILSVGDLSFLGLSDGNIVSAFIRLLIGIMLFTILFAVTTGMGGGGQGTAPFSFLSRAQAGVISAIVSIITVIFLPPQILLAAGAGWATAIALILIGGPIVGLAFLLWKWPGSGNETKATVTLKIILCVLLLWILIVVENHVGGVLGGGF